MTEMTDMRPKMKTDDEIIAIIDAAFGTIAKPEHFTQYQHCEECAEHNTLLRAQDRQSLRIEHVNNPGWDPLCFCSAEGKAYFMPALARFALMPSPHDSDWYGIQLIFHLLGDGPKNALYTYCNATQRQAVAILLAHFIETRPHEIEQCLFSDDVLRAYEYWS